MPAVAVAVAVGATVGTLGASIITAVAVGGIAGLATKYLAEALVPDMGDYATDPTTDQSLNTTANDVRKIVYGKGLVGGKIVGYAKPTIGGEDFHIMVLHLVGHPCESVELYEIEGNTPDEVAGRVSITKHLGDQDTVDPTANQYISGWTSDHIGRNQTYVTVKAPVDDELFPNGLNEIKFIVKGHKVYDPRKDDTVGGAGDHRYNDENTWEWSDNPELCSYHYLRTYGAKEVPQRRIPIDFLAQAANYCDEMVSFKDSNGDEQSGQRFAVNGVINNGIRQSQAIAEINGTMGAKIYRSGGKIYIKPAMYAGPATTVIAVDEATTYPEYRPHRPYKEKINVSKSEFLSPDLKWQMTNAPVVTSEEYRAADGAYLESSLRLPMVTKDHQAQRLAKLAMERSRAGFTASYPLTGIRLDIVPGNNLQFLDPETGINKEFLVEDINFDTAKIQTKLTLIEDGPEIYPDDFEAAEGDLTPNTTLPDATAIVAPNNLQYVTKNDDSWRHGVLTWEHLSPASVINYIVSVSNKDANTPETQLTFTPVSREQSLANLSIGEYFVAVSARNRFKTSPAAALIINIGSPSTPIEGVVVNILPGRVIITGPTLPHNSATYEWRYSFDGAEDEHFNAAYDAGRNASITITNTPHDGVLYVWYRIVDGDQSDPNWRYFSVEGLIGTTAEVVDPNVISQIQWPGLPVALGEHLDNITNDLSLWSTTTSENGDQYQQLSFQLTAVEQANQINQTNIIALKQQVGTETVQTQISENNVVQIGYENEDGEWVVGAPLARAFQEVKVVNGEGEEVKVISFMQALENSLGELEAAYYLGIIDENEQFTGLEISGGNGNSDIHLYMDNLKFASQAGVVFFSLNTITGKLEIGADTEFKGTLRTDKEIRIASNVMYVSDYSGFGPDNLHEWKGPPILDADGEPDWNNLTKANATMRWADAISDYFGGTISSGILKNSGTSTLLSLNPSVEVGPFTTNGNPKVVNIAFTWKGLWNSDDECPTSDQVTPSATVKLERSLGGGGWETLQTLQVVGEMIYTELNEPEISTQCVVNEVTNYGSTFTDTSTSTGTFSYRLVVSNQQRYLHPNFITNQSLSLVITEEPQ